jgi:citronellol/citronellal dehydrogenase
MHGIRVNAVAPGVIKTSGTAQYPPDLLALSTKHIPLKRMGGEEEVSHLIVYLCSPQADYVTGQVMIIDGGQSLWSSPWIIPDDLPTFPPYPVD